MIYSLSSYIVYTSESVFIYRKPLACVNHALTSEFSYKLPKNDDSERGEFLERLEGYFIIDNEDLQGFNQFVEVILNWKKSDMERYYKKYVEDTGRDYHKFPAFKDYIY